MGASGNFSGDVAFTSMEDSGGEEAVAEPPDKEEMVDATEEGGGGGVCRRWRWGVGRSVTAFTPRLTDDDAVFEDANEETDNPNDDGAFVDRGRE